MEQDYKGYRLVPDFGNMIKIIQSGKGMVPIALRGLFTTRAFAERAVDDYLDLKDVKDGKTNSGS